jgi:hypothetical protein
MLMRAIPAPRILAMAEAVSSTDCNRLIAFCTSMSKSWTPKLTRSTPISRIVVTNSSSQKRGSTSIEVSEPLRRSKRAASRFATRGDVRRPQLGGRTAAPLDLADHHAGNRLGNEVDLPGQCL